MSSRWLRIGAALAVVAASAPAWSEDSAGTEATAADASPYLVNVGPAIPGSAWVRDSYRQHFENARSAGLGAAFIPVAWSDVETVPGSYDFSGLDDVVATAHEFDLDLVFQVQTTGEWSVSTPALLAASGGRRTNTVHPLPGPVTAAPMNIDAALPFWTALVTRYHPGGDLAVERGWSDGWGVRSYEVENEPDFQPWPGHGWETVPKDYALYVSHLRPAVKAIDSSVELIGPALSGVGSNPALPNTSVEWLATLLSNDPSTAEWASDQLRATLTPGAPVIGAGPLFDVWSFHCDFADGSANALARRTGEVRDVLGRFATQQPDPTPATPRTWCSEGAPTAYDSSDDGKKYRFAWAQMQFAAELLGAGNERVPFDLGLEGGDSGATWQADPIRSAGLAMSTYFPSGHGVTDVGGELSAAAGTDVVGFRWTDPTTGLASTILWAPNQPSGSGGTGAPFTVDVPVATAQAVVVDPTTWEQRTVDVVGGAVPVTLTPADPSPPWIVVEAPTAARG